MTKERQQSSPPVQTQEQIEKQEEAIRRAEKLEKTIKELEQAQVITQETLSKEFTI